MPFPLVRRRLHRAAPLSLDEAAFLEDLVVDVERRGAGLRDDVDALPDPQVFSGVASQVRIWLDAVEDLGDAARAVLQRVRDPDLARLFALDGALATLLSRAQVWCAETGLGLGRVVARLRRCEPVLCVGPYPGLDASLVSFVEVGDQIRRAVALEGAVLGAGGALDGWPAFDREVELLLWATEWLHLSLASEPCAD
jgi:hypothetical protein